MSYLRIHDRIPLSPRAYRWKDVLLETLATCYNFWKSDTTTATVWCLHHPWTSYTGCHMCTGPCWSILRKAMSSDVLLTLENLSESIQQNPPWHASPRQARWTTCHKITNMSHEFYISKLRAWLSKFLQSYPSQAEMLKTSENPQSYTLLSVRQRTLCERMQIWLWNLVDPNRFAVTCHPSLLTECYAALPLPGNKMKISSGIGRISLIRLLKYIKNTNTSSDRPTGHGTSLMSCNHCWVVNSLEQFVSAPGRDRNIWSASRKQMTHGTWHISDIGKIWKVWPLSLWKVYLLFPCEFEPS